MTISTALESWEDRNTKWACSCGALFDRYGEWFRHKDPPRQDDCKRIGLIDADTGEVLIDASAVGRLDKALEIAREHGLEGGIKAEEKVSEGSDSPAGAKPTKGGGGRGTSPSSNTLRGFVVAMQVPLWPSIFVAKAHMDAHGILWNERENRPYDSNDPEEMGEWLFLAIHDLYGAVVDANMERFFPNLDPTEALMLRKQGFVQQWLDQVLRDAEKYVKALSAHASE